MKFYPCGALVVIRLGNIPGMITAVVIRFDQVSYEITYNDGGVLQTVVLTEYEFVSEKNKKSIGFKK